MILAAAEGSSGAAVTGAASVLVPVAAAIIAKKAAKILITRFDLFMFCYPNSPHRPIFVGRDAIASARNFRLELLVQ